jgi:uncharacterized protein
MMIARRLALLGCILSLCTAYAFAIFVVPEKPTGYVNDYAGLLTEATKKSLEVTLATFTASTSNEVAVVIIPSLEGDAIERYANMLFTKWKIGTTKHDNGVLLLISRDDRRARIEVGYGLEGAMPDVLAAQILNEKLLPEFKDGRFDAGVVGVVDAIIHATEDEYTLPAKKSTTISIDSIFVFGFFGIQGLAFLSSIFARSKSWWAGGVVGLVLGLLATFFHVFGLSFAIGAVVTFFLSIFGLLFDFLVSSAYKNATSTHAPIPWWAGGNTGGFRSSSGGSSFGGFGGGRSGGGGASSSW